MAFRIFLGVIFLLTLNGCATTARKSNDQAEMRISELENKLEEKDDQIRSLQAQLEGGRPSRQMSASVKSDVSKVSKKEIQTALKNAGYYEGAVDGKFGAKTSAAIAEFQKANGLKQDGKVGAQTWAKLGEYSQ